MKKRTKKKKKQLNQKKKAIVIGIAVIMSLCVVTLVSNTFSKYDGLGLKRNVKEHDYSMTYVISEGDRLTYEDQDYQAVQGIDVSVFQGDIDWEAVKADGIDFVMIRLGYRGSTNGKLHLDSTFKKNISGAKKAGLDVGVYFFSQAITPEEAMAEARFVLKKIRGKGVTYPIAFDMEPINGSERAANLTVKEKTQVADAFCQIIKRNGYTPMVYGNPQWLEYHIERGYLTAYDTWLAHYANTTHYTDGFKMWQYTDNGRVHGIDGPVDMNLYFVHKN